MQVVLFFPLNLAVRRSGEMVYLSVLMPWLGFRLVLRLR